MTHDETRHRSSGGPLKGLRVLDLGNHLAAPMAGCLLADFGAEVVKVEHPALGDDLRNWPPMKDGKSLLWKVTNRNKTLITLNLAKPKGQDLLRRMLPWFDILLENFRPGTMERWDLGYEKLAAINPRIIMVRISGYGQTGPYSRRPGYGTVGEAMSGVPSFTGFPDGPPTLSAFPLVDALASLFAVGAAMMATYERDVHGSGQGQVVDVSLYESLFRVVDRQVVAFDQLGIISQRNGNRMPEDAPRNTYRTADGEYVAISAGSQRIFSHLAATIGMPELGDDPRFCSNRQRVEHVEELDSLLAAWFERLSLQEAMRLLEEGDVVAGPVYDIQRIFSDPHYAAREDIVNVPDQDFGSVRMQAAIPKFSRTPGCVLHSGRSIGVDNERFYTEIVGLTSAEIEDLRQLEVL